MGEQEQAPSELVAGKYRLTKLLGRGGMGSVWEGVHQTLGTRVACKFIEAEYAESPEARSRFENEARAAAALRSKHVVDVYDHGVTNDGRPYIVMEYLSGEPLDVRLDRVGRLSLAETSKIITQVARGLSRAHKAGIVHRDLKPENVFLVWDDEDHADVVKVVDFGIAKFTDAAVGISSATRTGSVLGTPFYMSPEQARGLRTVDHRSDLWSVGVIAFRCVVGRLPFESEALGDLLVQICTGPIPVPSQIAPDVSPAFDAWIARALSREPGERFPDVRTMAEELNLAAGGEPRPAMPSAVDAEATGRLSALSAQGQPTQPALSQSGPMGGVTNIGLSATTAPARSSKTPLVVGLSAGVLVVGIGIAFAAKVMGGSPDPAAASGVTTNASEAVPTEQPAAPDAPTVAPAEEQREATPPLRDEPKDELQDDEADANVKKASPATKPAVRKVRPRAVAKSAPKAVEPAPPPAKPAPTPQPKVAPKPRRAAPKKTSPKGVDLGY